MRRTFRRSRCRAVLVGLFICNVIAADAVQAAPAPLELSRPVRAFEFLPVVGRRAALFGNETGNLEAWVYPLKILRNFRINILTEGRTLPGDSLARTLTVRPESATILYSGDTFSVRETLFVPVREPGAVITFEVRTVQPLEIEAIFERDFQLEWPAAIGGTYINWDTSLRAFYFGEEQKRYAAFVGSPSITDYHLEYFTNYSASRASSFRLGVMAKGTETKVIVFAASMAGPGDAQKTYQRLLTSYPDLLKDSANYYKNYLAKTVSLTLPDPRLQQAYDWSRISMVQGMVDNPFLGTGLVAGYRTSGDYERPGFAWFFGRDALWTSLALDASGDFASTRTALDFLSKYQRADGKIEHEISQAASLVDWFKNYVYGYASADATPLYIITLNDYVTESGDDAFAKEKWESVWRAYEFLRSTYDTQGMPQNFGIGHGWIEGGPLLPVKQELYQVSLAAEAQRALSHLARLVGKNDAMQELSQAFQRERAVLNQVFWSPEKKTLAYALDKDGKRLDVTSVLATVPMWFELLDNEKAEATINQLADYDHETDWGMRIISSKDPRYNPGGYHFGAVWPLFTGWASVGEYRYHRAISAYSNLRTNALMTFDGSLGHVTEVLSGDYYQQLSTSSPHQIWSAAMVVSPILRGMLGLRVDAISRTLTFTPELPATWTTLHISNLRVAELVLDLSYRKTLEGIALEIRGQGTGECMLDFAPALSLRAEVHGAEVNTHRVQVHAEANSVDQHLKVSIPVSQGMSTVRILTRNDFGLTVDSEMPPLGSTSRGLRITSEDWNRGRDTLELQVSGIAGAEYDLGVWNPGQIASVDGAELISSESTLHVKFPTATAEPYVTSKITIHFSGRRSVEQHE
jgi:glycogen debranching enzyme